MSLTDWAKLAQTADDATKVLPVGVYPVQVTKAEAVTASTGAPMLKLIIKITGEGEGAGRQIWTNVTLTADNPFALRRSHTAPT